MSLTVTGSLAPSLPADAVVRDFAEALSRRDVDGAARLLSPDVEVRALLPSGLAAWTGVAETIERFQSWFGRFLTPQSATIEPARVEDRYVAGWRVDADYADGSGRHVIEQRAVVTVGTAGIERIDLVCTGFRKVQEPGAEGIDRWDAGGLGCSDGLPKEFRRRIEALDAGGQLEVTVRDPTAREDLPPLARMMGHTVEQVDEPGDGRLVLTIRRGQAR